MFKLKYIFFLINFYVIYIVYYMFLSINKNILNNILFYGIVQGSTYTQLYEKKLFKTIHFV